MVLRSRDGRFKGLLLTLLPLFFACASPPRLYLQYDDRLTQTDLQRILAEHRLSPSENIKVVTLGRGEGVSHHIVQVRGRELPHVHKMHDLTVTVLQGRGYLILEKERIDVTAGDVLFIPRGASHYFVNTHREPSVALAVFTPPFDGRDSIPINKP